MKLAVSVVVVFSKIVIIWSVKLFIENWIHIYITTSR
jgi:hypothetical protein